MLLRQTKIPLCGARAGGGGKERWGKEGEQGEARSKGSTECNLSLMGFLCTHGCGQVPSVHCGALLPGGRRGLGHDL